MFGIRDLRPESLVIRKFWISFPVRFILDAIYMKILAINKFYYLKGGAERHFFELNEELRRNGHEVIPWAMASEQNEASAYSRYFIPFRDMHRLGLKSFLGFFYNFEAQRALKKIIQQEKPELAHLHNIYHQFSPAIIRTLKKAGIPVVMTLHDYKIACPNTFMFSKGGPCRRCVAGSYLPCFFRRCVHGSYAMSFLALLEAWLHRKILKSYEQVDLFIAPSQYLKDTIAQSGIPKEKILVLKNFVPQKFLKDFRPSASQDHFLYYGRLSPEKGVGGLIEAVAQISGAKLRVVGAGPDFFVLQKLVLDRGLAGRVELIGPKYGEALLEEIRSAKAVIIPSLWPENMPLTMLEAMAQSKVVVASRLGGLPEIIQDGQNGFLFTAGNQAQLKNILENLENSDLLKIGAQARQSVEKLKLNVYARDLNRIYLSLVA